jgi:hypothetical protein
MARGRRNPWARLTADAWMLGLESSVVIGQRTLALMAGGAGAQAEAVRMVREKVDAAAVLQGRALAGRLGASPQAASAAVISHYRRRVRANRRRLAKA